MADSRLKRRVVVTATGVATCNGLDTASFWDSLIHGRTGVGPITQFDTSAYGTTFAGTVPLSDLEIAESIGGDSKTARRKDRFVLLALRAAHEAMTASGLDYQNWADPFRVGVIVGAGIGGLHTIEGEIAVMVERGPRRVSPFLVPKMIVDSAAGDISISYGAKGPNFCITTACATATHCIGAAYQHIASGICDIVIAGGCEAPITPLGVAGFNSIKALSTRNDSPQSASRPFDAERDGFVMAEGAGILILEEYEHAKARGAEIVGEIVGYACTGDAFHETAPDPEGTAGAAAMRLAIADAGIDREAIGYFNAHGTSTKLNDATETLILKKVFGDHAYKMAVSSTKSMTGHTLGAAGGVEGIASLLTLKHGIIHPTINYQTPDPDCDLDYVPNVAREQQVEYALSNNLGFGGHNACLVFKRFSD
ncbi:MAG: beta-ketoacyl-[acyl-carrier-protein] synthase II [Planctomycetota bacterium]|nr:MAG: beta-ketoacyl-[acyl-carrier-protein] synthase II [Planctomycetota bacterium]